MSRPELEIIITKSGQVTVEVKGAKGPRCLKYAELVRELVGREEKRHLTREYYEPDSAVRIDAALEQRNP